MIFHIPVMDFMHTSKCNLQCKYCFEAKKIQKNLTFEEVRPYLEQGGTLSFFLFGGEPLMNPKFLEDFFEYIGTAKMPKHIREKFKKTASKLITNATLLEKNIDLIKKYNLEVQISIDGPKKTNDMNRVHVNGRGSYDDIMRNTDVCSKEKVSFSFHGVINKKTLPYLEEISIWFFEMTWKYHGLKRAMESMGKNCHQVIFEEDYTDGDVDIFLDQVVKFCEYIWNHKNLKLNQKKQVIANYLHRKGGVCGAGASLLAVDTDMNIFPCHRQADNSELDKELFKMGNIYDNEGLKNFKIYNNFYNINKVFRKTYSYRLLNSNFDKHYNWLNWCPSTNAYTSGANNPYYINPKYIIRILELIRLTKQLMEHYNIPKSLISSGRRR